MIQTKLGYVVQLSTSNTGGFGGPIDTASCYAQGVYNTQNYNQNSPGAWIAVREPSPWSMIGVGVTALLGIFGLNLLRKKNETYEKCLAELGLAITLEATFEEIEETIHSPEDDPLEMGDSV
jgi:hypothetical protein